MLLLMRRVGEIIRINEKITIQIKEIHATSVTFVIEDLSDASQKANQEKNITIDAEENS